MWEFLIPLFAATVQSGTPILYATLGEMMTEKGGVLNLGVEGMMAVSALAAFCHQFHDRFAVARIPGWRHSPEWSWAPCMPLFAFLAWATRWFPDWP